MDLDTIGAALKRKLGPLPVWMWAMIGGAILYFLRQRGYLKGGDTTTGEALQPSQRATDPRQAPTVLQPGESAYDPNSGTLTTAPGGGGDGGASGSGIGGDGGAGANDSSGNSDLAAAFEDLAAAMMGNATESEKPNSVSPRAHKPTALERAKAAVVKGKIGPKNRARLKGAGYSAAQISYHLRRHTALGKPRGKAGKKAANTQTHGTSTKKGRQGKMAAAPKARSAAQVRTPTGGRTAARGKGTSTRAATGARAGANHTPRATPRQRPKTPTVTHSTPVHHPVSAAHTTATTKATNARAAAPPARPPSAPAPRNGRVVTPAHRAPAKHPKKRT